MSANQPVDVTALPPLLEESQPTVASATSAAVAPTAGSDPTAVSDQTAAVQLPDVPIATLTPPPPLVVGVPINPRTGEPRRPVVVAIATVLCWLAVAITGAAVLLVYWDAVSRFAEASWLMGQFVTGPGSLERVLLAVAVTAIGIIVGTANAIVGYYAWTGYRWTRIAGLISATLTCGVLVLNQLAWFAVPAAVAGSALLWLPPAGAFFTAWRARRHPELQFAPPTVDVVYGPLPRFQKA